MPSLLIVGLLTTAGALATDPWGRPDHLRAVRVPARSWADRSRPRPVRVFWDGDQQATVAVLLNGRWRTLSTDARSGFTTPVLPVGTPIRVRLQDGVRWSPPLTADPVDDPVATGRLGGWGGADVVGQITLDRSTGDVYASTVGGGLLVRPATDQPLAGTTATVGSWQVLGRADGLPDARVVAVDARDGTVLVGTAEGLAVVESGRVSEVVDTELPDPWVQAVHVGADGALWAGTFRGLAVRAPDAQAFATVLEPWSVFSLSSARTGGVWAGYEGLQHVTLEGDATPWLDGVHVYGSVDTPDGPVVATTESGVLTVAEPHAPRALSRVVDRDAYGVALGPGGVWTAAGQVGLVDPQGGMWGRGAGLPAEGVRSVLTMPDGSLFVGTDQGIARVVPREGPPLVDARQLGRWPASSSVADLLTTPDGLWVAGTAGIQTAGRPHPAARDLVVAAGDDNRALSVGTDGATWAVGERVVRLDAKGDLDAWWPPARIEAAAVQEGAGLYVGGADGLWRLDVERDRFVPVSTLRDVTAACGSPRGVWVASGSSVFRVVGSVVSPYLETGVPLSLAAAPDGVWVGTRDGLERLRMTVDGAVVDDVLGDDDLMVAIPAVASDDRGVWFATEAGQVGRVVDGRVGLVSLASTDPPTVTSLAPDGDAVWVGTEGGVYRVWLPVESASSPLPGG